MSTEQTAVDVGAIEGFLCETVEQLEPKASTPARRGRPKVLPSMCLWAGLLVCVLRGFQAQRELWRLLSSKGLWEYPRFEISDQAVYNRLSRAGIEPLEGLFERISQALIQRLEPFVKRELAPFAEDVVAIDQTKLDKVARKLPKLREVSVDKLLPGALSGVFDIRLKQWRRVEHTEDVHQNEKVSAQRLVEGLARGTLILADLGYFGFEWFDDLTEWGYYWVSRLRKGTSYEIIHTYYKQGDTFDGVIFLGKHRADRARYAVRLVQFEVRGIQHNYITNVLDPKLFPIAEIARVYARRWDFEMAVNLVKRHLGLHVLWSSKQVVVIQQVWAVLIISQVLQALRIEVAGRAEVEVDEVSMELMIRWMPRFAQRGMDPVKELVEQGRALEFIRPSRRIKVEAPNIPADKLEPLPVGLVLVRKPRYANRNCGSTANK